MRGGGGSGAASRDSTRCEVAATISVRPGIASIRRSWSRPITTSTGPALVRPTRSIALPVQRATPRPPGTASAIRSPATVTIVEPPGIAV